MKVIKSKLIIFLIMLLVLTSQTIIYALPLMQKKEPKEVKVPIIMYHLITKNSNSQGKYAISPSEMESDLKYLKENGYETILMSDLINFVNKKKSLPKKPIILSFDDGRNSDYDYLFPLLKEYDMKAVLSIVVKFTDDYSDDKNSSKKPHLVWEQIQEMKKSKIVEIQNHSYNLHGGNGSGKKRGEAIEDYRERLRDDLSKGQSRIKDMIKFTPTTFTYPLGIISKGSEDVLKDLGFKASLSCAEGMNIIQQGDDDCLFQLKRNIRRSGKPIGEILEKLEK